MTTYESSTDRLRLERPGRSSTEGLDPPRARVVWRVSDDGAEADPEPNIVRGTE